MTTAATAGGYVRGFTALFILAGPVNASGYRTIPSAFEACVQRLG